MHRPYFSQEILNCFQSLALITLYLINIIIILFLVKSIFEYFFHQNTCMVWDYKTADTKILKRLSELSTGQEHSHKKQKDCLETWAVLLICTNFKYLGWPYREYIKTAKNGGFYDELLSENDFEAVLATFCCYVNDVNASEAIQKIAKDQKDYYECSLCFIVW